MTEDTATLVENLRALSKRLVGHQDTYAFEQELIEQAADRITALSALSDLLTALKAMDALVESLWDSIPWSKTFNLDVRALNEAPLAAKTAIAKAEAAMRHAEDPPSNLRAALDCMTRDELMLAQSREPRTSDICYCRKNPCECQHA